MIAASSNFPCLWCVYEATDSAFCTHVDCTLPHRRELSVERSRDRASVIGLADFDASTEVKGAKTTASGELLLRMLQFEAPYPGHFQELRLYRDGVSPDVSECAELGATRLTQRKTRTGRTQRCKTKAQRA